MKKLRQKLRDFQKKQALISLERDEIDANTIQAFVLGVSRTLVLLQYVYDFRMDGLALIRLKDISRARETKMDRFQRKLLKAEGLLETVDLDRNEPIDSYARFLRDVPEGNFVILENESCEEPDFLIGPVTHVDETEVHLRFFTGDGRWKDADTYSMKLDQITSCQVETNYIQVYERHFERQEGT